MLQAFSSAKQKHGGVGGEHISVGSAGQDCRIGGEHIYGSPKQHSVGDGGEQMFVGPGVSGIGGSSSVSHSQSKDFVLLVGSEDWLVSRCSRINMHRLLSEDKKCMLSGIPPTIIDMKKSVSLACAGNPVAEAQAA